MTDPLADAIVEASKQRPPELLTTPLSRSNGLSKLLGCEVLLKCDHLQTTGSFKYRGAVNKIRLLTSEQRQRGIVTASSGNHGQAVALAGRTAGVTVTVYVTKTASPMKLQAIRGYGADVRLLDASPLEVELTARREADATGKVFISPYNDFEVIAGQGTAGLEIVNQEPDIDAVFLTVGGGGLAAGVGIALKAFRPSATLVGCWPEVSPIMLRALELGYIHDVHEDETISDATVGGIEPGSVTFPICAKVIDRKVTVSEALIRHAMWQLAEHERWMTEGAASVALAGLFALREEMAGKKVAVLLCGRNITSAKFVVALTTAMQAASTPAR